MAQGTAEPGAILREDRKSTRLNSSHPTSAYAVYCTKKKNRGRGNRIPNPFRNPPADRPVVKNFLPPPGFQLFPYTTLFRSPSTIAPRVSRLSTGRDIRSEGSPRHRRGERLEGWPKARPSPWPSFEKIGRAHV